MILTINSCYLLKRYWPLDVKETPFIWGGGRKLILQASPCPTSLILLALTSLCLLHFLSPYLTLPYHQPTVTRRTSGHCLGTFIAENLFLPSPPPIICGVSSFSLIHSCFRGLTRPTRFLSAHREFHISLMQIAMREMWPITVKQSLRAASWQYTPTPHALRRPLCFWMRL
jgi:hypothetical protein